jgi:hypothetical protein
MRKIGTALLGLTAIAAVALTSCDSNGNSISGSGFWQMYAGNLDSLNMVYSNVDLEQEADSVLYENSITINNYFKLRHYCYHGSFAGGLTATSMADSLTAAPENYSSVVKHSVLTDNAGGWGTTYFVGDLNRECSIYFNTEYVYGVAVSPKSIWVTNAAYTYQAMLQGTDLYPAYTAADYLTLHISALDAKGNTLSRSVSIDLASSGRYVDTWKSVDLSSLGECYGIRFNLEATGGVTDSNIPLPPRFCVDYLTVEYSYSASY